MAEWTYAEALRTGLADAMASDGGVFLLGEDVAYGGPFGVTRGLADRFGSERVLNTPISEAAITGFAVGAALAGRRPVVEIMFMDFITLAMDMLVNQAAKMAFFSAGQLTAPVLLRVQAGVLGSAGAHHSQSFEAWLTHVPGIRVIAPATPEDAYQAVRWGLCQSDPVVLLEHKGLYGIRGPKPPSPADNGWTPTPRIRREGSDVTVVTYSSMVRTAVSAAELASGSGVEAEVVDMIGLSNPDWGPVLESLRKTHRALILHEAVRTGGIGGEWAALLQELAFDELDAPIARMGSRDTPVPFSPNLEKATIPSAAAVAEAIRQITA